MLPQFQLYEFSVFFKKVLVYQRRKGKKTSKDWPYLKSIESAVIFESEDVVWDGEEVTMCSHERSEVKSFHCSESTHTRRLFNTHFRTKWKAVKGFCCVCWGERVLHGCRYDDWKAVRSNRKRTITHQNLFSEDLNISIYILKLLKCFKVSLRELKYHKLHWPCSPFTPWSENPTTTVQRWHSEAAC